MVVQTFADDVSAAVGHCCRKAVIRIAWMLGRILLDLLEKLGLGVSLPKCDNSPVECLSGLLQPGDGGVITLLIRGKLKEQDRKRMMPDLGEPAKWGETSKDESELELPFPWKCSFRLLGVVLDCQWVFGEHAASLKTKATKRVGIVNRAGNTTWGLESRILTITVHALIESLFNYGLTVTGSAQWQGESQEWGIRRGGRWCTH